MKPLLFSILLITLGCKGQTTTDSLWKHNIQSGTYPPGASCAVYRGGLLELSREPRKYVDTVGAKIIIMVTDSTIKTIHGYIVHIYYDGVFMNWETWPTDEMIFLNERKKIIDGDKVLKYILLYPIPDRRPRGI